VYCGFAMSARSHNPASRSGLGERGRKGIYLGGNIGTFTTALTNTLGKKGVAVCC